VPEPIPLLTSKTLERAGFAHAFTTRKGGVSEPPFESLDFATLRDPAALCENQRRLADAVGFDCPRLYQTRQVHGRAVVVAKGDPATMLGVEADALVAEAGSNAAVAVRVADCVPVLIADPVTGHVAAVHAGWRGVVVGVIDAAVDRLCEGLERGAPGTLVAAIGPSIGPCCFEVGLGVAAQIEEAVSGGGLSGPCVVGRRDEARGKAYVDLRSAVRRSLGRRGMQDAWIDDVGGCTRCDPSLYYSFRREGDRSGRLLGVIVAR
jgi:YfiH family protein